MSTLCRAIRMRPTVVAAACRTSLARNQSLNFASRGGLTALGSVLQGRASASMMRLTATRPFSTSRTSDAKHNNGGDGKKDENASEKTPEKTQEKEKGAETRLGGTTSSAGVDASSLESKVTSSKPLERERSSIPVEEVEISEIIDDENVKISPSDKFFPVLLKGRPVVPGVGTILSSTDRAFNKSFSALFNNKKWDRRMVAFFKKSPEDGKINEAEQLVDPSAAHGVGVMCRAVRAVQYEGTIALSLLPLYRVKIGSVINERIEPVHVSGGGVAPEGEETTNGKKNIYSQFDGSTRLDTTSFEDSNSDLSEVSKGNQKLNAHKGTGVSYIPKAQPIWMSELEVLHTSTNTKNSERLQKLGHEILSVLHEISQKKKVFDDNTYYQDALKKLLENCTSPDTKELEYFDYLADYCGASVAKAEDCQRILEALDVEERLEIALEAATETKKYWSNKMDVVSETNKKLETHQREYFLREQMKIIKQELGINNDKDDLISGYRKKLSEMEKLVTVEDGIQMNQETIKFINDEINKLDSLDKSSSEYSVSKTYLDWIMRIPWGVLTKDKLNVHYGRKVLDEGHSGLKEVKDRILEFIATGKLTGNVNGKVICLAGPPGVGKTSIAASIAKSLDRKFYRFSLGGLNDTYEIKGHRRTYVGALPGRIIQSLVRTETQNPVILIDEIDKLRVANHGDPAAALLEVFDTEQNHSFMDNYLDIPVDISKVLFICTANDAGMLTGPLADRMEIIQIAGYIPSEKLKIASQHLIPKAKELAGLKDFDITLTNDAVERLIRRYTMENGVRGLKASVDKVFRKVAFELTSEYETEDDTSSEIKLDAPLVIDAAKLETYLGPPLRSGDKLYEEYPVGVALGLAVGPAGGTPLFVESVLQQPMSTKNKPRVTTTGQLGEVMTESSSIALSFARMYLTRRFSNNRFFDYAVIHTHFPEGAVKKDGPSAGITTASSLISLALKLPINSNIAMTGELTLSGKILPIGGLKEKTVAAKSIGIDTILFPKDNLAAWEDLPDDLKEGLTGVPVGWYDEAFPHIFGDIDADTADHAWSEELSKTYEIVPTSQHTSSVTQSSGMSV